MVKSKRKKRRTVSNKVKESSKKDMKKEFRKLNKRLNEIEQEVNIGSLDNVIIALMILIIGISVSVLTLGFSSYLNSPTYLVVMLVIIMFTLPLMHLMFGYLDSIIFKHSRFHNKINVITILLTIFIFLILVIGLPILLQYFFPNLNQGENIIKIPLGLIVFGIPIYFGFQGRLKIIKYFVKNYPNLILKKISKMNKEQGLRELKNLKVSYKELKNLADNFS